MYTVVTRAEIVAYNNNTAVRYAVRSNIPQLARKLAAQFAENYDPTRSMNEFNISIALDTDEQDIAYTFGTQRKIVHIENITIMQMGYEFNGIHCKKFCCKIINKCYLCINTYE